MHGRVKVKTSAQKAAEKEAERARKLAEFQKIKKKLYEPAENSTIPTFKQLLESTDSFIPPMSEYLSQSSTLAYYMKDWPILWQLRLTALQRMTSTNQEKTLETLENELELTFNCLVESPKSYSTWAHRRNILKLIRKYDEEKGLEILKTEIGLTEKMLMSRTEDQVENQGRNFHCWDHRRLVLKALPEDVKTEIQLTTKLIQTSFSNFSAWHYRSKLLNLEEEGVVENEMDLVLNAVFTDPSDASSWIYHRHLISNVPFSQDFTKILQDHQESLKELLVLEKEEDNNVSTLRSISLSLLEINSRLKTDNWEEKSKFMLNELIDIDPIRRGYYLSRISKF
ncbi:unnamed protein product [Oikopleura dioica]|uniref:Geranylgeranyl transferase type-2 subunit alpha n=1 Tax=Oikopleura dioica TaxID=34765 RepID=E4YJC6_OIKDI|nr:unnamed protein product [Oikopleura dioica]